MLVPPSHLGHLYATVAASLSLRFRPPNERRASEPNRRAVKVSKTPRILGLPLRPDFPLPLDPTRPSVIRPRPCPRSPSRSLPSAARAVLLPSHLQIAKVLLPSLPYLSDERASMPCSPSSGDHNSEGSAAFLSGFCSFQRDILQLIFPGCSFFLHSCACLNPKEFRSAFLSFITGGRTVVPLLFYGIQGRHKARLRLFAALALVSRILRWQFSA